jgi:hypothetical protein
MVIILIFTTMITSNLTKIVIYPTVACLASSGDTKFIVANKLYGSGTRMFSTANAKPTVGHIPELCCPTSFLFFKAAILLYTLSQTFVHFSSFLP